MVTKLFTLLGRSFAAGETADDAVQAARRVNAMGMSAVINFVGEDVVEPAEAAKAAAEYVDLIRLIHVSRIKAHVTLKLSQVGALISKDICFDNLAKVMVAAAKSENTVWLDMEGSALTQKTIAWFETLRSAYPNTGLCLQASLVRTGGDLDRLMRLPLNVRLCKGAYQEPASIAYTNKRAVDGNFRILVQKVLANVSRGVYPAFATHDRYLVDFVLAIARDQRVEPERFEFEVLYGAQDGYLRDLVRQGYQGRVYIPYGRHWLRYFGRRVRERKENLFFAIRRLLRS